MDAANAVHDALAHDVVGLQRLDEVPPRSVVQRLVDGRGFLLPSRNWTLPLRRLLAVAGSLHTRSAGGGRRLHLIHSLRARWSASLELLIAHSQREELFMGR